MRVLMDGQQEQGQVGQVRYLVAHLVVSHAVLLLVILGRFFLLGLSLGLFVLAGGVGGLGLLILRRNACVESEQRQIRKLS
jgi:Flp pilus assembly protein TadB